MDTYKKQPILPKHCETCGYTHTDFTKMDFVGKDVIGIYVNCTQLGCGSTLILTDMGPEQRQRALEAYLADSNIIPLSPELRAVGDVISGREERGE